jgi:hypothetical protein
MIIFEDGINWVFPYDVISQNDAKGIMVLKEMPREHKSEFSYDGKTLADIRGSRVTINGIKYDAHIS